MSQSPRSNAKTVAITDERNLAKASKVSRTCNTEKRVGKAQGYIRPSLSRWRIRVLGEIESSFSRRQCKRGGDPHFGNACTHHRLHTSGKTHQIWSVRRGDEIPVKMEARFAGSRWGQLYNGCSFLPFAKLRAGTFQPKSAGFGRVSKSHVEFRRGKATP